MPILEYDDDAESGRDAAPVEVLTGNAPNEFVLGWKSNSGDSKGATPYWSAISRPRSRGILQPKTYQNQSSRVFLGGLPCLTKFLDIFRTHPALSRVCQVTPLSRVFSFCGLCLRQQLSVSVSRSRRNRSCGA